MSRTNSNIFCYEKILFEYLLAADHGKTVGYDEKGDPILLEDEDCIAYQRFVNSIQNNIISKFKSILQINENTIIDASDMCFYEKMHSRMMRHFSLKELKIWYNLAVLHRDSFLVKQEVFSNRLGFIIKKKIRPFFRMEAYLECKNGVKNRSSR